MEKKQQPSTSEHKGKRKIEKVENVVDLEEQLSLRICRQSRQSCESRHGVHTFVCACVPFVFVAKDGKR